MGARILVPAVCQPHRGLACNSCRKRGSSQWHEGRRWRIAWSCIRAKTLKAWGFVSVSHFGFKSFFLVPHLSIGWGGGGAPTCTDTLFQSLPLLPAGFSFPPIAWGCSGSFKCLPLACVGKGDCWGSLSLQPGFRANTFWQTTPQTGECPAPNLVVPVRKAIKQGEGWNPLAKSASRGGGAAARRQQHSVVLAGARPVEGPCGPLEDRLSSSPATVPPSHPSKKLFFHLERLRVAMKTDFPRGLTLPLRGIGLENRNGQRAETKRGR